MREAISFVFITDANDGPTYGSYESFVFDYEPNKENLTDLIFNAGLEGTQDCKTESCIFEGGIPDDLMADYVRYRKRPLLHSELKRSVKKRADGCIESHEVITVSQQWR